MHTLCPTASRRKLSFAQHSRLFPQPSLSSDPWSQVLASAHKGTFTVPSPFPAPASLTELDFWLGLGIPAHLLLSKLTPASSPRLNCPLT